MLFGVQYTDETVMKSMPTGKGYEATVEFFRCGRKISNENLAKEYKKLGLRPADPYEIAAVNEADPHLADKYPNGTHWRNKKGRWCFIAFNPIDGLRYIRRVFVRYQEGTWSDIWWFGGVRIKK